MILPLLCIRVKQLQRELNELGLYLLLIIPLAGFLVLSSFKIFEKGKYAYFLIAALVFLCLVLQYYQKDKRFIYKNIASPHLQIFIEYTALTFPFSFTCIITRYWFCYPVLLTFLFCIPFVRFNIQQKVILKNLSAVIAPSNNLEWLSGFRKHFISFTGLYVLALAFCWFKILPLFLLWLLSVLIGSFYTECESIQILRAHAVSPKNHLFVKFKSSAMYMLGLFVPVLIINTICNREFLLLNLLFIPAQISIVYFAICLKYSSYRPNKNQLGNNIPLSIVSIGSAIPYLLPVPAILSLVYFYKAENNLKKYLDD